MGRNRAFVVPVCTDATPEREADVPDSFVAVQWTRMPGGETPPAFVERIKRLLSPELSAMSAVSGAVPGLREPVRATWRSKPVLLAIVALFAALAYLFADKFWISKHLTPTPAAFAPSPHSIAVLPFVNLSGDKEQEYFSDGLTEELLNSLAAINELQVAARTSAFSFKGTNTDIGTIARKLNVGAVLEGSVRRSAHTIRVTAQLINAVTGFHLWSKTYDRDLGDVLKLQTEIATAVASGLKVTLLGDVAAKVELGGTRNPAAFDAYLRASKAYNSAHTAQDLQAAIAAFSEAIRLDPDYALALAGRSRAITGYTGELGAEAAKRENGDTALNDARRAIALAPELADGHEVLGLFFAGTADYPRAMEEYERAAALAPGSAQVLREYGRFVGYMGRSDASIAASRRAVVLDPLNPRSHYRLAEALYNGRRYDESVTAYQEFINLDPDSPHAHAFQGISYYGLGDLQRARAAYEIKSDQWNQLCLALVYQKLGRHTDAEAQLAKIRAANGDSSAYQYGELYAQWGNSTKALDWLETALRLQDSGQVELKTDPLLDPLRKEPRFQAIERALKFPN
jgi:TolB-like protein/lipoprotein NlpI